MVVHAFSRRAARASYLRFGPSSSAVTEMRSFTTS
jgi:hypothetical protein